MKKIKLKKKSSQREVFLIQNIFDHNLASVITAIGLDHTDWLPKHERTIDKIIYEKTSSLLD